LGHLQPGDLLAGRYRIQGVIGRGGMSAVYRARDMHFPNIVKLVAVKEMLNTAADPQTRETIMRNFQREAHILAGLSHPSIPHIYDFFSEGDHAYLVLEYIPGKNLETILNETQGFLPEKQVVEWAIELCDVLHYLHTRQPPVVFRDMKPANVMITPSGRLVLVDFGIAKLFQLGQKGTMIGTEGYAAPEQYRGEAPPSVDIYALGATLHHLLTKRDPRAEPPFSFHERPIRSINPNVSPELEAIVNRALAYNPEERFQSAKEMKEALLNIARKSGVSSLHLGISDEDMTRGLVGTQTVKELWRFEAEDEIRGTPMYRNGVVYFGSYDNNLYAVKAEDGKMKWKFPSHGGVVTRPATDGRLIFFGSEDGGLYALEPHFGRQVWRFETKDAVHSSPIVSQGFIFFGSDDGMLYAVHAEKGTSIWTFEAGSAIRSTPHLHKDALYFGTQEGEFYAVSTRGKMLWRYRTKRGIVSSPTVAEGTVYFAGLDGVLYALDAQSGWLLWRFRMGKGSVSSPAVHERYVVLGAADGIVYCVDAHRGREIWHFQTNHQVPGSPLIYQDTVYIGSADGNLYSLDLKTGKQLWKFQTQAPITGAPIIAEQMLFFGSLDHNLYALAL